MLQISQVQQRWAALDCDVRLEVKSLYKHSAEGADADSGEKQKKEASKKASAEKGESRDDEEKDNTLLKKGAEETRARVSHATEDADEFCPAKKCADLPGNDLSQWDCFADSIFGPPPAHARYVAQNCRGMGMDHEDLHYLDLRTKFTTT